MRDKPTQRKAVFVHIARCIVVALLMLAIPAPKSYQSEISGGPPSVSSVAWPGSELTEIGDEPNAAGLWPLLDREQKTIGFVARTLPEAKEVVGYRGPTESTVTLDPEFRIVAVRLFHSSDTEEHVAAVINAPEFFEQFRDWNWGKPPEQIKIDGVSGATLTSLALAEGVLLRIGGNLPSLVFAEDVQLDEVTDWFAEARSVINDGARVDVYSENGKRLGRLFRSGPFSDDIIGYQGPSELLIRVDDNKVIQSIRLRKTYDNQPYVDYVRTERGFWRTFVDRSLDEVGQLDLKAEGVEGVSGATMTSMAVAETIVTSAKLITEHQTKGTDAEQPGRRVRWSIADIATLIVLITAACLSRLKSFHVHWLRRAWLVLVTVVIGFWSGNLVSMALIAGWSAEGVAWRLAPGLAAITVAALLLPPATKGNPYCNHLCPHGSLQQLIKPSAKSRRHWHLSPSATTWLTQIPGATLTLAYVAIVTMPTIDLSSWEPFHAYLFRIAGWGSVGLAAFTLAVAAVIPMGYCRLGCPTGRLIGYLRRSAKSDLITRADVVAAALLLFATTMRML